MPLQDFIEYDQRTKTLFIKGKWNLANSSLLQTLLKKKIILDKQFNVDGNGLSQLDSAGVLILLAFIGYDKNKEDIQFIHFLPQHKKLLFNQLPIKKKPSSLQKTELNWIQELGRYSFIQSGEFYYYLNFVGEFFFDCLRLAKRPLRFRWNSLAYIINQSGTEALPIIALLAFSIGVVIAYQMGTQLRQYGADIFIVNLLGLSVLREFGPLLTAIMVGGRTGSAFTAQLGIMKINQEIDALKTMGARPVELLLIPRLVGLVIVVPLLTIWADIFGILGGMLMTQYMFEISMYDFLIRFQQEIPLKSLIIGIGKAPVFALIIASVGCFEGIRVRGSAESVGTRTTSSVVISIFFIIIFDGLCSVLLSKYKL